MKRITGVMFYYYFVCKRKLWCFGNEISLENESESVMLGKLIDESSYSKARKHILIDDTINIDFIKDWRTLHEIKKSRSIEEASIWQVKYYLYFLKMRGIVLEKGIIDFPKIKQRKEVFLDDKDIEDIENILKDIEKIIKLENPPNIIESKICKKCAFYEYCYI